MRTKMGLGWASWNFLIKLFLLVWAIETGARELKMDVHDHDHDHAHHPSHMDPRAMLFFHITDLKVGNSLPIFFDKANPAATSKLLPREEADPIPFSLKQLPSLLEFFSISPDSPQAKAMEDTLSMCEVKPSKGEIKYCATSLESMLDFARIIFGSGTDFKVVTTKYTTAGTTRTRARLQNYTIVEVPEEIPAPRIVACHYMSYPYAIFGCHSQMTENKVYRVPLGGENGDRVNAIAVCHMDTSDWNPNHVSFQILGTKPGSAPVCHFFPEDNLLFVPVISPAKLEAGNM